MITSLLNSFQNFQNLDNDFKQIKSTGKYNELCKLLSFIITISKVNIDSFKTIMIHTLDSLYENPLTHTSLPKHQPSIQVSKPGPKNLSINTREFLKDSAAKRPATKLESPKIEVPKNLSKSTITSPKAKNGDPKTILNISFSSPLNSEIQKKLEGIQYSFSENRLFEY